MCYFLIYLVQIYKNSFTLAKRLSKKQKEEILKLFTIGKTIEELSIEFDCTKLTISRNLKKNLSEQKFKELITKEKLKNQNISKENKNNINKDINNEKFAQENKIGEFTSITPFVEITPLDFEIENAPQKDLSSIPISEIQFPKLVFMIVDKKIELETKYLNDYPDWQFLSKDEINRKTIEIYEDLKIAKRFCNKERKVIKIPNTEVFKIVAPILVLKGISRIVCSDKLIAL